MDISNNIIISIFNTKQKKHFYNPDDIPPVSMRILYDKPDRSEKAITKDKQKNHFHNSNSIPPIGSSNYIPPISMNGVHEKSDYACKFISGDGLNKQNENTKDKNIINKNTVMSIDQAMNSGILIKLTN